MASRTPLVRLISIALYLLAGCALCLAQAPIAGENVNMVSGTDWTTGDPFLQRQNEPSIAVLTRNPQHLLAAANDYRHVDLPGLLGILEQGDAWLGVYKSFDGGLTWSSAPLPGFPLDTSPEGLASPLRGMSAAADPTVRGGSNGLGYLSGIAFNRGNNALGVVFVARYIDNNNRENGDPTRKGGSITNVAPGDSIRYISTSLVDSGTSGQFLDKPWLAVDVPRGFATCQIPFTNPDGSSGTQTVPAGPVFLAYSSFTGSTGTKIMFARSMNCGLTWDHPIKLSESNSVNQGTIIAIDLSSQNSAQATIYVAWRRFSVSSAPGALMIAKSTNGGQTFSKAVEAVTFPAACASIPTSVGCPFDQSITSAGGSIRTNTYPALAVDANGRVYLAWSRRQANGDARVTMAVSSDGVNWPATGTLIDNGQVADDNGVPFSNLANPSRGHQLMPTLTFNAGKLTLVYYDLRLDHTLGIFTPLPDFSGYAETRRLEGELDPDDPDFKPAAVFNEFLSDGPLTPGTTLTTRRHTIDVAGAQADPQLPGSLVVPTFAPFRVSRYAFGINPFDSSSQAQQLQVNVPNLPLFVRGTQPFLGDYIDLAGAPAQVMNGAGKWIFNTAPSTSPLFHAVWTDNRDVRPPPDGDWTNYTPPFSASNPAAPHASVFDGTQTVPPCTDDSRAGMRNQNIYTSRIAPGVVVASPGNSKPLGFLPNTTTLFLRTFTITVQNTSGEQKSFRLTINNQPALGNGSPDPSGSASFLQFGPLTTTLDVSAGALSGVSRPVFVKSSNTRASVTVSVQEITGPGGALVPGGLQGLTVLNPDPTSPTIIDPENPAITNPAIINAEVYNPAITNPAITNPAIVNPAIINPAITNPAITNPAITNPAIVAALNPAITNPAITNPAIVNPAITNPAIVNQTVTDANYTVVNTGNTAASYAVKLFGTQPAGTSLQLILSKLYRTPAQQNCQLALETENVVLASIPDPVLTPLATLGDPNLADPAITNATLSLAPGEAGVITIRGNVGSAAAMQQPVAQLTPVVVAHAANTLDGLNGITQPPATLTILTTTFVDGIAGVSYQALASPFGGIGARTWSVTAGALPPGLMLNATTGAITGTPTATGTFTFTLQLTDSAVPAPNTVSKTFTLSIAGPLAVSLTAVADGVVNVPYSQTLTVTGGTGPFTWTLTSGSLPAGLTLSSAGVISGTPTANTSGTSFTVQVKDSGSPQQTASQTLAIRIAAPLTITTASLAPAGFGAAYSQTLAASGGTGARTWTLASGSGPLPTGLSISSAGVISGTPTVAGTFSFVVQVTDSSSPAQVATKPFTLTVGPAFTVVFTVQPSDTSPGAQITPAIKVVVRDATGKLISGVTVTLTIEVNPGGAVLSGTTVQTTNNSGVAVFASNSLNKAGTGYRLRATANLAGAVPAISNPFNIR
ncbi:MAG: putative Ig domain-containing protein [Acidobacteriales bacterium]|nr:putative Ig domain-containing protein [Terriglobales bacterium]